MATNSPLRHSRDSSILFARDSRYRPLETTAAFPRFLRSSVVRDGRILASFGSSAVLREQRTLARFGRSSVFRSERLLARLRRSSVLRDKRILG